LISLRNTRTVSQTKDGGGENKGTLNVQYETSARVQDKKAQRFARV
jgi:hypothetical protein